MSLSRIEKLLSFFDPFPTSPVPALPVLERAGGEIQSSVDQGVDSQPDPMAVKRGLDEIFQAVSGEEDDKMFGPWHFVRIMEGDEGLTFTHLEDRRHLTLDRDRDVVGVSVGHFSDLQNEAHRNVTITPDGIETDNFTMEFDWSDWDLAIFVGMAELPNPMSMGIKFFDLLKEEISRYQVSFESSRRPQSAALKIGRIRIDENILPEDLALNVWDPFVSRIVALRRNEHILGMLENPYTSDKEGNQAVYDRHKDTINLNAVRARPIEEHEIIRDQLTGRRRVAPSRIMMGRSNMARIGARVGV